MIEVEKQPIRHSAQYLRWVTCLIDQTGRCINGWYFHKEVDLTCCKTLLDLSQALLAYTALERI